MTFKDPWSSIRLRFLMVLHFIVDYGWTIIENGLIQLIMAFHDNIQISFQNTKSWTFTWFIFAFSRIITAKLVSLYMSQVFHRLIFPCFTNHIYPYYISILYIYILTILSSYLGRFGHMSGTCAPAVKPSPSTGGAGPCRRGATARQGRPETSGNGMKMDEELHNLWLKWVEYESCGFFLLFLLCQV